MTKVYPVADLVLPIEIPSISGGGMGGGGIGGGGGSGGGGGGLGGGGGGGLGGGGGGGGGGLVVAAVASSACPTRTTMLPRLKVRRADLSLRQSAEASSAQGECGEDRASRNRAKSTSQ